MIRKVMLVVCIILFMLWGVLIWRQASNMFIATLFNFFIFTLLGIRERIKPDEKEIYNMKQSRRIKNKPYISDEEYIAMCRKYSTFYLIGGGIFGIYIIYMLIMIITDNACFLWFF